MFVLCFVDGSLFFVAIVCTTSLINSPGKQGKSGLSREACEPVGKNVLLEVNANIGERCPRPVDVTNVPPERTEVGA